jgi:hypothetical protein
MKKRTIIVSKPARQKRLVSCVWGRMECEPCKMIFDIAVRTQLGGKRKAICPCCGKKVEVVRWAKGATTLKLPHISDGRPRGFEIQEAHYVTQIRAAHKRTKERRAVQKKASAAAAS